MKKLTLFKGKAIACLVLMCLFLAQACRKDRGYLSEPELHSDQLIQQTVLKKWFETNKNSKLLKLDWKKARQGIVDGKNVVRIPTINPENSSTVLSTVKLKNGSLSSSGLSAGIGNSNAISDNGEGGNYNPSHPPELFFIQDGPNGKLHSYLLNFIPKDKNKENGDNGVWTGKLLEWNVQGDTVLVQELEQSKVKTYYAIKPGSPAPSNLSNVVKNNKLQSINPPNIKDKKVSDFFGWLLDKISEFAGWVGSAFGLSTHNSWAMDRYNGQLNSEWQLNIDFSWLTGSGGGGPPTTDPGTTPPPTMPVSANMFSIYTGAGVLVYQSYVSGYIGGGTGTVGTSPGSGGPDIYHPYPVWNGESIDATSSGGPSISSYNLAAQYLINQGWVIGGDNIEYINSHKAAADALVSYIDKISNPTQNDIDFLNWSIQYLHDNPNLNLGTFTEDFLRPTVFDNPSSPVNAPDVAVINNGIEIENILSEFVSSGRLIATSPNRGNTEDMTWGTNGDISGIRSGIINNTNTELFGFMTRLFELFTINDTEMLPVANDFIETFRNNTGSSMSHSTLNRKVRESSAYINFIKKFGDELKTRLQTANGNINNVAKFDLDFHPTFDGLKNKFNGLQILINDTEQTDVKIDSYSVNANNEFTASLSVTIHDHFGLDKHDALTYQYKNLGFAAWWLLQHTRGYRPFETIVNIKTKIHGHL